MVGLVEAWEKTGRRNHSVVHETCNSKVSGVIAAPFSGGRELGPDPELACECGEAAHHCHFSNFAHLPLYHGVVLGI
jgi:hypothetical protein